MFGFLKPNKKVKGVIKTFLLWHQACSIFMDQEALNTPRGKLGAACFFVGSIDAICQPYKLGDKEWALVTEELITSIGFPSGFSKPIIKSYCLEFESSPPFIQEAIMEGGKATSLFLSGKNKMSPMTFMTLLSEWSKNPDLSADEVSFLA
jgi:hypothetical protein